MKLKSKKTLLWTLAALVVLSIPAVYLGGRLILRQRIRGWRDEGLAAAKAGDHERAATLLVRYLQRRSSDPQTMKVYIDERRQAELPNGQHLAEVMGAIKVLLGQLSPNDPELPRYRKELLELYVKFGRRPEALDLANAILKKDPKDLLALELRTETLIQMGQDQQALDAADAWAKHAPDDLKMHMARATARIRLRHPVSAILTEAKQLREKYPNDPRFEFFQGYAHIASRAQLTRRKEVEVAFVEGAGWLRAAAKHPGLKEDFVEILVEQFDRLGMSADSASVLEAQVKAGASAKMQHALASRLWERGQWARVTEVLKDLDPANANSDATLVAFKAIALANTGNKPQSDATREALSRRNQAAARAWTLLLRRIVDAASVDDKQLEIECRSALVSDPRNSYLNYYLGDALARLSESEKAIGQFERAAFLNSTWSVPTARLIDALIQTGKLERAKEIVAGIMQGGQWAGNAGVSADLAVLAARAFAADASTGGELDGLLQYVTEIQTQLPGNDQTALLRIQLLAQKGDKDRALGDARAALARTPPAAESLLLNIASVSRNFGLNLESECFAASEKAHGPTAALAYSKAIDHLLAGDAAAGLKDFDEVASRSGKSGERDFQFGRARYLDFSGNPEAKAAWIALADKHADNLQIQRAAVMAASTRSDRAFLDRAIERIKNLTVGQTKNDTGITWRLDRARALIQSGRSSADYEQASVDLNEIIKLNPQLPEPRALLARALVKMNRVGGAIEQLTEAAKLDPFSVPIALDLASLLQASGDFDRAARELERVEPQLRTPAQRRQAAIVLAQMGSQEKAVKMLEQIDPAKGQDASGDGAQSLLLAWMYRRNGQFDKAEEVVKKLVKKPDVARIQFAASLYAVQGKTAQAEQALASLDSLKLEPGIKEMIWGSYRLQTANVAEATKLYAKATELAPKNGAAWRILASIQIGTGQHAEAMATIQNGLAKTEGDSAIKSISENAALLTQSAADETLRPVVLRYIANPQDGGPSLELLRIVGESRPTGDMERFAAQIQQFVERNPAFLPGHVQLMKCYAQMGRPREALGVAQRTMSAFPNSPEPAKVAVQLCATTGNWSEMLSAAQAWKRRSPQESLAADLSIARALIGQGQFDSAAKQLQSYLPQAEADPERWGDVLVHHGIADANAGRAQAVADRLWPLVSKSASGRVRWMMVAQELTDTKTAAAWLDRIAPSIPADAYLERVTLAEAYDRLGRRAGSSPELIKKATEQFAQIAADPKAPTIAILGAAVQAERTGDLAAAETLYRRVLQADPNVWIAKNNLAMVITRRGGDTAEAARLAGEAAQAQPAQATVRDTLAQVQAKAGQPKSAANTLVTAVKLEPDNPVWRVRLARYLLDAGDLTEASRTVAAIDDRRLDISNLSPSVRQQLDGVRKQIRGK
jgi:predicted Zn-dependent protease